MNIQQGSEEVPIPESTLSIRELRSSTTNPGNMEQYSLYIGIIAGVCTSFAMLPQLIKIIKDRKAGDISYGMLFVLLTGLAGWLWYGILQSDVPIIATNSFSIVITLLVLFFSIKYK